MPAAVPPVRRHRNQSRHQPHEKPSHKESARRQAPQWTSTSTRASSTSPVSASRPHRRGGRHRRRGRRAGRGRRLPRRGQGPGQGRRPRQGGGVKLAADADEVRLHAGNILGLDIKGHVVKRLWIEHASDIAKEYYASFTLDRQAKLHLGMLSAEGGVEIEEVAETNPDAIAKIHIDPVAGSTRSRPANGSTAPTSTPRPPSRRRRCSCAFTTATSRATATWPRSTR